MASSNTPPFGEGAGPRITPPFLGRRLGFNPLVRVVQVAREVLSGGSANVRVSQVVREILRNGTDTSNPPLVGVFGTGSAGSLTDEVDETGAGVFGTGVANAVSFEGDASPRLDGVFATGVAGSLTDEVDETGAGVFGAGIAGTVAQAYDVTLTLVGVFGAGTAGTVAVSSDITLTLVGVHGTGVANDVTATTGTGDATAALTGVHGTGHAGSINPALTLFFGVFGVGEVGQVSTARNANIHLPGVFGTGVASDLSVTPVPIFGVHAIGVAGFVHALSNNPPILGVNGIGVAGLVSTSGDIVTRAGQIVFEVLRELVRANPTARASQQVIETLAELARLSPTVRATQQVLEAFARYARAAPKTYAGQIVVEVLVPNWKVPMPDIYPVLPGLAFDVVKRPNWGTQSDKSASGREARVGYYAFPLWDFELNYSVLRDSAGYTELKRLIGFYNSPRRMGGLGPFLIKDPDDNAVTGQLLGIGDDVTRQFTLVRDYGSLDGTSDIESVVTITASSPALVNWPLHGLVDGDQVRFSTDGVLPSGVAADTTYYVISPGLDADNFEFSATKGGGAIDTSGSQSGTHLGYALRSEEDFSGTEPVGYVDLMLPFQLYVDGAPVSRTDGTYGYSVFRTPFVGNYVLFNTAPVDGQVITADFSYYYYCRFSDDSLDFNKFSHQLWSLGKVKLTSLRE